MITESRLIAEGYDVVQVQTGEDAVEKAKEINPGVILMDIILPDIDGSDAVKQLQEDPATEKIKVIFLSSIVTDEEEPFKSEVQVGGRKYPAIGKPLNFDKLLPLIEKALL